MEECKLNIEIEQLKDEIKKIKCDIFKIQKHTNIGNYSSHYKWENDCLFILGEEVGYVKQSAINFLWEAYIKTPVKYVYLHNDTGKFNSQKRLELMFTND